MEKTALYWKIHKDTYNILFEQLDSEVQQKIIDMPASEEAVLFAATVDRVVQEKISLKSC